MGGGRGKAGTNSSNPNVLPYGTSSTWHIHAIEYYAVIKKSEAATSALKQAVHQVITAGLKILFKNGEKNTDLCLLVFV